MSSRKLNHSRPITDFFARSSEVSSKNDKEEDRITNAAGGRMVPMTASMPRNGKTKKQKVVQHPTNQGRDLRSFFTPAAKKTQDETVLTTHCQQDDREGATTDVTTTTTTSASSSSSSSSSLVTTPRSTAATTSVRLVTTQKKRKDPPLSSSSDTTTPSMSSSFSPSMTVKKASSTSSEQDSSQEEDDEEAEDKCDTDEETDGTDFRPIECVGEVNARRIIKPFCVQSAKILKEENFFESPFGKFASHLKKRTTTCNSGVYCILSADGTKITKIGSTRNFQRRYRFYQEQFNIEEKQFFIMVDFSSTNEKVDQRMNETYHEMMDVLATAQHLDPFQNYLAKAMMERGGDLLGMKETVWIQMIEIGLQYEFGLDVISEFVMYNAEVVHELYNAASTQANRLMRHLSVLRSKSHNGGTIPLQELSSWMSGVEYLSSNVVTSRCILGDAFKDQFVDTIPFPPVANPRTTNDCFDKSKYTPMQKKDGRTVLLQTLTAFLKTSCGVLFMDTNKLILDDDPNCRRSAHDILTEDFQFHRMETFFDGEIMLYLDHSQMHAVILHRPVCVASDSREVISDSLRWKRGISVSTLCNVGRLVRGEPVLSPQDRFSNPIHAMLAFHVIIRGYHGGLRQAAAFYRDFVTPETNNALVYNALAKSTPTAPTAKRLRWKYVSAFGREVQDRLDDGERIRRQNFSIIEQGRSIINQAPFESKLWEVVDELKSLFRAYTSLMSANFRNFVDNHLSNELKEKFLEEYEKSMENTGNRTIGNAKANTKVQDASNDGSLEELLKTHGPRDGKRVGDTFWIKDKQDVREPPADGTPSTDPSIFFPNGKLVYDDFCYEGLRERFKKRVRQETCKNTTKAIRYAQFALKTCMVKKQVGRNQCAVSSEGYILVYIVKKEDPVQPLQSAGAAIVVPPTIVPLEWHSTQRVKIPNWTHHRECVVCVAKARIQYPNWNRDELRKQKVLKYSRSGCPECKKGNGVAVCQYCWDEFDHQKYMM
ncbi:hypothetical protein IV203_005808 [Nitzschia inconspicua]|uniref:Uncharacterized protein n=1 Tax=Nitzschia inconspicua TaxID=303405 RepID=A0A9K3PJ24_9STRA|nr:hypothetical protein IV203_005808 [Nitzschia inconspicua]